MNLVIATIPEDVGSLPGWLDRQLVGPDLAALVAELQAVHGDPSRPVELAALVDPVRDAILQHGLESLPRTALTKLLTHPELLLELQEMVLIEGGPYWQELTREAFPVSFMEPAPEPEQEPRQAPRRGWLREALLSLTTAAALLLAVFLWMRPPIIKEVVTPAVAATGWGWDKPGALPDDLAPPAYLDRLASAADDWKKKRPDTVSDVAKRIGELRRGCTTLILAAHPNLAEPDRKWLQVRCREWGIKIDEALVDLEAGRNPVVVRGSIDTLIEGAASELRERATKLRA